MSNINYLKEKFPLHSGTKIWAIGGGKGGVGKSLVTANLSICLSLMGYKVIAIDMDLGGANLHTCMGLPVPNKTLSDYITKKVKSLSDLLTPTPIENLHIISGAQDEVGIANLKYLQKAKLISKLSELDADFILLDLGAGTTYNTLDFFLTADQGILVSLPEPTSIENTYRFIKSFFYRKLKMSEELLEIGPQIDTFLNSKMNQNQNPMDLINSIKINNPAMGRKLSNEISKLNPKLIINQTRTQADIDVGHSVKIICHKYFGFKIDFLGHLEYDATVWQSVKRRKPLLIEFPNSDLVNNFEVIVQRLLNFS